ncbi:hypothetical protein E1264_09825 [Actinomadura sp. KC216]|nr:hypothetical protein E1264_09825 [Actinomadura sp. KC216]
MGDWGSGKSSLMKITRQELLKTRDDEDEESPPRYLCVPFNPWQYEDFDDVKVALMIAEQPGSGGRCTGSVVRRAGPGIGDGVAEPARGRLRRRSHGRRRWRGDGRPARYWPGCASGAMEAVSVGRPHVLKLAGRRSRPGRPRWDGSWTGARCTNPLDLIKSRIA